LAGSHGRGQRGLDGIRRHVLSHGIVGKKVKGHSMAVKYPMVTAHSTYCGGYGNSYSDLHCHPLGSPLQHLGIPPDSRCSLNCARARVQSWAQSARYGAFQAHRREVSHGWALACKGRLKQIQSKKRGQKVPVQRNVVSKGERYKYHDLRKRADIAESGAVAGLIHDDQSREGVPVEVQMEGAQRQSG
jgi:hypothetical protein